MWIPLVQYAVKKGVSLSTLRRHIKANKVLYKVENGRYLLHDPDGSQPEPERDGKRGVISATLHGKVDKLEKDLQRAREEIAELKTLIAFYEEQMAPGHRINN